MLDADISTTDALRLLCADQNPDERRGPNGWTRRTFLQAIGLGAIGAAAGTVGGTLADTLFGGVPDAWASPPIGATDGILITIMFYGGNDGMNMFVPHGDPAYYSKRSNIAIPAAKVLQVDGGYGFAPQLTFLNSLYAAGQVAAIRGVGYANPDLSHFNSMASWMAGKFSGGPPSSGWLGRWFDGIAGRAGDLAGATLATTVPLHMLGNVRRGVGISDSGELFGASSDAKEVRMYNGIRASAAASVGRGGLQDSFASALTSQLDLAVQVAPVFKTALPNSGELTRKLTMAARLINADIGLRVLDVGRGGFDTHEAEGTAHPRIMQDLDDGLKSFFATLSPAFRDRVTIMTMSEFGRTPVSNSSGGTDHGTAATHFVIGPNVRGGLYGTHPSLTAVDRNGRMVSSVDYRAMYGSVLDGWMGGGASSVLEGGFENLSLFRAGPGTSLGGSPIPVIINTSAPSGFVPLNPVRVLDSREPADGGVPLDQGAAWDLVLAGKWGIPADATAVALNITSVDATTSTFVTAWPRGERRPFTANLIPVPGMAVPNLVIGRLGAGGALSVFNNTGSVHLVADLVGYFTTASNTGLTALTPSRLLDTRDGSGDILGPIGEGQAVDLVVAGRGGVPADSKAVALNVTVTEPTAGSFLTVWPAGQERPLAASVNMVPNQTVPNMVLAAVGVDGKVSIFNNAGSTHVVVDVLGSFGENGGAKFCALTPSRALDTREGLGAPVGPVGQTPLKLSLVGQNGIPGSGVSAVLLNITAIAPTIDTFITVYPSNAERPLAANLNAIAGQIVPNMVLGRLAKDGSVSIYNNTGNVNLVADVMGYFA